MAGGDKNDTIVCPLWTANEYGCELRERFQPRGRRQIPGASAARVSDRELGVQGTTRHLPKNRGHSGD